MKAHHYLGIGIRLFSIWLFLYSVTKLSYLLESLIYGTVQGMSASFAITFLQYVPWLLFAIFLWLFPLSIAKNIVPSEVENEINTITPREIMTVLISVVALCFLYRSIMDALYWVTLWNIAISSSDSGIPITFNADQRASMYATAIEFFVAVMLFFNSRKVAYIASKF